MKTKTVKMKLTGPQGSGKTILLKVVRQILSDAGVWSHIDDKDHSVTFPVLKEKHIQKLLQTESPAECPVCGMKLQGRGCPAGCQDQIY